MISVKRLYDAVQRMAAKDQKGYNMPDDFNGDLADVQIQISEHIYPFLEETERAVDILAPMIIPTELTSTSLGVVTKPADYAHQLQVEYKDAETNPATYIRMQYYNINGVAISKQIPQRAPSAEELKFRWSFVNDKIQVYPEQTMTIRLTYLKNPPTALIAFTENTSGDEDFLVYNAAGSTNLVWPESCFNLFLYLMLEKLGVQIGDQILMEYSQLGFAREKV